jgi:hypothetical protein
MNERATWAPESAQIRDVHIQGRCTSEEFAQRLAYSWRFRGALAKVLAECLEVVTIDPTTSNLLLEEASREQDLMLATDYTALLEMPEAKVALRVRKFDLLRRFGGEVVLRYPSEARKILTNHRSADLYVYAFADPSDCGFAQWLLPGLHRLRSVWADSDRRASLLQPQVVDFAPNSRGMVFQVANLQRAHVIMRALLIAPAFDSTTQVKAFLTSNSLYQDLSESLRNELALLILQGSYRAQFYLGSEPLGR